VRLATASRVALCSVIAAAILFGGAVFIARINICAFAGALVALIFKINCFAANYIRADFAAAAFCGAVDAVARLKRAPTCYRNIAIVLIVAFGFSQVRVAVSVSDAGTVFFKRNNAAHAARFRISATRRPRIFCWLVCARILFAQFSVLAAAVLFCLTAK
jgi:hypothetical protein